MTLPENAPPAAAGLPSEPRVVAPERSEPPPRIYVASLSDYNDGRLHGAWIPAAIGEEALLAAVQVMLKHSPSPGAEEVAIHDYEGFGPLRLHEFTPMPEVAAIATGIVEHGEAFACWYQDVPHEKGEDLLEAFAASFAGEYDSWADLAREELEASGIDDPLDTAPEHLRPYLSFDYEAYGRDLLAHFDVAEGSGRRRYVFWAR